MTSLDNKIKNFYEMTEYEIDNIINNICPYQFTEKFVPADNYTMPFMNYDTTNNKSTYNDDIFVYHYDNELMQQKK